MNRLILIIIGILMALDVPSVEEHGDRKYRKRGLHNGNLVETLFWNFGEVAWWRKHPSGVWPRGTDHSYMDGITPIVAAEVVLSEGDTIHIVEAGYREHYEEDPITGVEYGWQPISGYSNPYEDKIAMSDDPDSWPASWPDKMNEPDDPGWPGSWNGYFGKRTNADQESYFVMDDYCDHGAAFREKFYCDMYDSSRGGLGMRVEVRGFQWSNVLAEDLIFWHYDITNISTTHYDEVAFGMYVDCGVGGPDDSNDDNAFYDTEMDITYSWDPDGTGQGGWETGYAGYAFLESPGNPYNGIDDDGDGRDCPGPVIDAGVSLPGSFSAGEQCVLIDYDTYKRSVVSMPDTGLVIQHRGILDRIMPDEVLVEIDWNGMDDNLNGLIDENEDIHTGLKYKDWITGGGLNNLLIDEARDDGIDNDSDWNRETDDVGADGVPGTGDRGEGDGIPSPGEPHFDETDKDESDQIGLTAFDRFYIGHGVEYRFDDVIWERIAYYHFDIGEQYPGNTAFLYGSGPFPLPPGKTERFSLALVFGNDLEDLRRNVEVVQKIYNANYNFARPPDKPELRAVAGDGKVTLYWDDAAEYSEDVFADSIGCEPGAYGWRDFEGYRIYRSTDPAFNDCYTITDGQGNPVLYDPLAQFDIKNDVSGFFPIDVNGVQYYMGDNTGLKHSYADYDVKNGQTYYYAVVSYDRGWAEAGMLPSECTKVIKMDVVGNVTLDKNTVVATPRSPAAGYKNAQVDIEHTKGHGTGDIWIDVMDPLLVKENAYRIVFDDTTHQDTTIYSFYDLGGDSLLFTSTYVEGEDFNPVSDGMRLQVRDDTVAWNDSLTGWVEGDCNLLINVDQLYSSPYRRPGFPTSYEIRIDTFGIDTSYLYSNPQYPTNFTVWDVIDSQKVRYYLWEPPGEVDSLLNAGDYIDIWLWVDDHWERAWRVKFFEPGVDSTVNPIRGDWAYIAIDMPFRSGDVFDIKTNSAYIEEALARSDLDRIAVVPNPYCAAAEWEPRRILASGRGERRIYFIHLPQRATIRIYTVSGELVKVIEHDSFIDNGEEPWGLVSKDGMDIAPGIYIYHVDAPGIGEKIGRFAIIK